ncbi:ABC transporter ATP-binding protein [Alpinimonas psychrophila]|uniref:ATP-binding cassette subfamily B protein n=1 Tax=Alpinimonas psychrophila TaxID=748908 RepID=A0A7W3JTY4_9MICO|nr:ABC transporter ATP-binding protein [Alpinimonas psychrophila]MBA8829135.1 ATP-binding cassette subfamily B protein [Alpinimonas psychrophila]
MSTSRTKEPRSRSRRDFADSSAASAGSKASFSQLMPYLLEHRRVLSFVIVLSILGAGASLAQPLLVGQVITLVGKGDTLGFLVWLLIGLVVASALITGFQHYLLQRTGEGVVLSSRRRLVGRILRLPIAEFDTRRTGDLVSRVGSDTTLLRAVLTQGLVEAIGGSLTFVGALVAMILIDPVLLGLTVTVVFVAVVVVVLLSRRIRVASRKAQAKVGELAASVERAISSVRTVRAANATEREIKTVEAEAEGAWRMGIKVARISALVVPIAGIAMQIAFLTVLGVGGFRVADGSITVAQLVTFILFLFMMIMPLGQAFGAITSVNAALGALGRIQEIIALPSEGEFDRKVAPLAVAPGGARAAIASSPNALEFTDVRFSYPLVQLAIAEDESISLPSRRERADAATAVIETARRAALDALDAADGTPGLNADGTPRPTAPVILHSVSFAVPHGKRTALVGPSGSGKSTIFALIERFYDPTSGTISLGGIDIRGLERTDLRDQIGYVEQDAPVLAGSLRDNLRLGSPDATDAQCIAVLHEVNLTTVLERTALGLDAPVGEEGVMLSGGERQRLAIARALLAAPPILLLDESTSSLDGVNEQLMREAIDRISVDRTLLIIAHRLSTVVDSDQIVVLENGVVVGVGTHSELVVSTPLYRDLAKHQLLV